MLSHRQNSRALSGRRWPGSGEARSREHVKNVPVEVERSGFVMTTPVLHMCEPSFPNENISLPSDNKLSLSNI
jgi:hypothetical protein